MLDDIAKSIALSLNDREFNQFLFSKVQNQWGGDFHVLLKDIYHMPFNSENLTVASLMTKNAFKSVNEFNEYKKLRILITEKTLEMHDFDSEDLVVFISPLADNAKTIVGYHLDGTQSIYDASLEPEFPSVIIGYCETCDEEGNLKEDFYSDEITKMNESSSYRARISGQAEWITYIECPDLSAIESWYFGKPELRFVGAKYNMGTASASQAYDFTANPSRSDASNGYSVNYFCWSWYFGTTHGPDYYIQTFETDDAGSVLELSVTVSTAVVTATPPTTVTGSTTFKITYKQQDKAMYGQSIYFLDPEPKTYNSDYRIHFVLDNKN